MLNDAAGIGLVSVGLDQPRPAEPFDQMLWLAFKISGVTAGSLLGVFIWKFLLNSGN